MANLLLADRLDSLIDATFAGGEVQFADSAAADAETRELLEVVAIMRLMPDPQFKADLKDDLLLTAVAVEGIRTNGHSHLAQTAPKPIRKTTPPVHIMPTLLGVGPATYPVHRSNFALSLLGHAVAITLLIGSGLWMARRDAARNHLLDGTVVDVGIYVPKSSATDPHGGGSGGDRSKTPASNGSIPRLAREQFTPPMVVIHNRNPRLAIEPKLIAPPVIALPRNNQVGDPLAAVLTPPSNGVGFDSGIGNHSGGGIGTGNGPGLGPGRSGGVGNGVYTTGGGVSEPRVIYRPDPEYSDEARKARVQGTVTIAAIIDVEGRPQKLRVVSPLGLGLDQKALEAVRKWRFQPAMKDSHAVPVLVDIEVTFRLY
jgi:periplasmic protein TonB